MTSYTLKGSMAAIVLAALGTSAAGAATLYTNEASFVAAAGTARAALPATLPGSSSFSAAPFAFTGVGGTFVIDAATYGNAIAGENNLLINGTETFNLAAATPLYAFGFDIFQPSNDQPTAQSRVACYFTCAPGPFTVELRSGATLVDSFTFTPASDAVEFHGYAGTQAFDHIAIIDVNGSIDDEYFANFRYSTSPVPLPAAIWLMTPVLLLARRRTPV